MRIFLILFLNIVFLFELFGQDRKQDLKVLLRAENEFSQAILIHGIKQAFLSTYADDAITFAPFPINGKKFYSEKEPDPGILLWKPEWADVSFSGDYGYTTGPWVYQTNKDEKPIAFGYYLTIWKKQADGQLKAVLDIGTSNPPSAKQDIKTAFASPQSFASIEKDNNIKANLLLIDSAFSEMAKKEGIFKAYEKYLSSNCRIMREGAFPSTERTEFLDSLSKENPKITWKPLSASLSSDRGFGYTYGTAQLLPTSGETSTSKFFMYMRIWKKEDDGSFKIAVDVLKPTNTLYIPE